MLVLWVASLFAFLRSSLASFRQKIVSSLSFKRFLNSLSSALSFVLEWVGLAASTALENLPVEARGIASGFLQEGYTVGYLFAAVIKLFLLPKVPAG